MNIKTFLTFSISAILLTTTLVSAMPNTLNSFAQVNNATNPMPTNNVTSMDSNTTNQNMTMKLDDNRNKQFVMDYNYYDKNRNYEKINGTVNMMDTMYQAIESKFNVTLTQAITTAEQSVGNGSYAMSANGEEKDGYLVYSIVLGSPDMKFTKVLVDPGNGAVLKTEDMSIMEWMMMMHKEKIQDGKGKENMMMEIHQGYGKDKGYSHK